MDNVSTVASLVFNNMTIFDDHILGTTEVYSNTTILKIYNITSNRTMRASIPLRRFVNPAVEQFYIICNYIIPFLAIVFNMLSICVLTQRRLSRSSVSTYLIALCVFDTLAVTMIFYTAFARLGWWHITDLGCKLSVYTTAVGRMCAIWTVVFFTAERLISVKFVFRKSDLITTRRIIASLLLLIAVMCVEQCFVLVWVEGIPPAYCFNKDRTIQRKYFLTLVGLNRVFNFLLPLVLVAVMNCFIVSVIRGSSAIAQQSTKTQRNEKRLTVMLILVSTINFVFLIPETTAKILEAIEGFYPVWLNSLTLITDVISYISHCCNFFFYVISGKEFRKDFVDLICCRMQKKEKGSTGSAAVKSSVTRQTSATNVSLSNIKVVETSDHGEAVDDGVGSNGTAHDEQQGNQTQHM